MQHLIASKPNTPEDDTQQLKLLSTQLIFAQQNKSKKERSSTPDKPSTKPQQRRTPLSKEQPHNAFMVVSGPLPHRSQPTSKAMPLRTRLHFERIQLLHGLQTKSLTFKGIFNCQRYLHHDSKQERLEPLLTTSRDLPNQYPLLTEKIPKLLKMPTH
ncbi:hypothetical protein ACOSQ3_029419 [Xanthoceras sorbifolium]